MLGLYSFNGPDDPGTDQVTWIVVGTANVIYQWEGTVHPFVTGGLGFYE